ncbi:hypothetical protein EBR56_03970 [bacterium]|nr:hypothetical protein [bacterium]
MLSRFSVAPLVVGALVAWGTAHAAHGAADKETAADKQSEKPAAKAKDKPQDEDTDKNTEKDKDKKKNSADEKPACMRCGATCGLTPVCACEPGTKKRPKAEFEATCKPLCVAGCTTRPWFLDWGHDRAPCTSCCAEPGACPSRVRWCKKLERETVDEEVPTVVRKVKYVCRCCSGTCSADCCGATQRCQPLPAWWTNLTWWWPRKPAG